MQLLISTIIDLDLDLGDMFFISISMMFWS